MTLALTLLSCTAALVATPATPAEDSAPQSVIALDQRRELFVDDYLIESLSNVRLELQHPQPQELVFETGERWEGSACGYFRVLRDGELYRMWYMTYHWPFEPGESAPTHPFFVGYAESDDGVNWRKPKLGLYEFEGSKDNNICCTDVIDNFTPFIDTNPQCAPAARYKAVGVGKGGLLAFVSPDGIHWQRMQEAPIITQGAFDSQNLAFWDDSIQAYRVYFRDFHQGVRDIRTATSTDFITWTAPEILRYQSDAPDEALYTNGVSRYYRAPHIYVGFPTRYVERNWSPSMRALPDLAHRELRAKAEQRIGTAITDTVFMTSRDGQTFHRWGEAFVRNGPERHGTWVYGDCYPAYGLVETASKLPGAPAELTFYLPENYWHRVSKMRRYTLRIDGFVAAKAPLSGGELLTKPITFSGNSLSLNFATSAAGRLRVEIQDAATGTPLPGFAIDDCDELFGDTLNRHVTWREKTDLSAIRGQAVRLRFVLHDADLYSFQFCE